MIARRAYVEAYKWFTLAAKNGHAPSLKDRAFIAKLWMKDYANGGIGDDNKIIIELVRAPKREG
jgi:hypothetical protein